MSRPARHGGFSRPGGFEFGGRFPMTPWVKRLLIANFAIWFVVRLAPELVGWLSFGVTDVLRRPWSPVTYMFVHHDFLHLLGNMIVLFFFGPPLESKWGGTFFLKYYVITGLGGALFSVLLYSFIGPTSMIGASGAMFGLLLAFALNWPDAKIYLYFLFPVPAKWFVTFIGLFTLFATVQGSGGGIAHWAHLGGLVTGLVYLRFGERIGWAIQKALYKEKPSHVRVEKGSAASRPESAPGPSPRARRRRRDVDGDALDEVDRILDKIRESGMDSLSPEERAFLDEMSRQYKKTEKTRMH